jgi:hypothetical protein
MELYNGALQWNENHAFSPLYEVPSHHFIIKLEREKKKRADGQQSMVDALLLIGISTANLIKASPFFL